MKKPINWVFSKFSDYMPMYVCEQCHWADEIPNDRCDINVGAAWISGNICCPKCGGVVLTFEHGRYCVERQEPCWWKIISTLPRRFELQISNRDECTRTFIAL